MHSCVLRKADNTVHKLYSWFLHRSNHTPWCIRPISNRLGRCQTRRSKHNARRY